MGGSLASSSMTALSMPKPAKAASTCSTVWTLTFPLASVVERLVSLTFSMRASISGLPSRSTRRKRKPGVRRRGQESHVDPIAAMQADARVADRFPQSLLLKTRLIKRSRSLLGKRVYRRTCPGPDPLSPQSITARLMTARLFHRMGEGWGALPLN